MAININTEKGFFTVEAAIFLPIFILGILTLGYLVKIVGITEGVSYIVLDETQYMAAQAYKTKVPLGFSQKVEKRVKKEAPLAKNIKVSKVRYLYNNGTTDGLISFQTDFFNDINLPLNFYPGMWMKTKVLCRGFVGARPKKDHMPFDEMEREGESHLVWIFPMAGKKYHDEKCTYVVNDPKQMICNQGIKARYSPCKLCHPEKLPLGSIIYCFITTGKAYHQGSCKTIDKYTVEIEKDEAKKKGYGPCSKCKGGEYGK
ncbi:MAG: hypothetical protein RSD88_00250 [Anaerovoracaceae bacterium]